MREQKKLLVAHDWRVEGRDWQEEAVRELTEMRILFCILFLTDTQMYTFTNTHQIILLK